MIDAEKWLDSQVNVAGRIPYWHQNRWVYMSFDGLESQAELDGEQVVPPIRTSPRLDTWRTRCDRMDNLMVIPEY